MLYRNKEHYCALSANCHVKNLDIKQTGTFHEREIKVIKYFVYKSVSVFGGIPLIYILRVHILYK